MGRKFSNKFYFSRNYKVGAYCLCPKKYTPKIKTPQKHQHNGGEHTGSPPHKTIDYTAHLMIWQNVGAGFTHAQMKTPQHKNMLCNRKGCPYGFVSVFRNGYKPFPTFCVCLACCRRQMTCRVCLPCAKGAD